MTRKSLSLVPLLTALALSACGGGGGGSSDPTPTPPPTPDPPAVDTVPHVAKPIPDMTVDAGTYVSISVPDGTFVDDDGDPLRYTFTTKPGWLLGLSNARSISGTPTRAAVGPNTVVITATDPAGHTATDTFIIHVELHNHAPRVQLLQDYRMFENSSAHIQLQGNSDAYFVDDDADPLTITVLEAPSWLTLGGSPSFQFLDGYCELDGTYPVRVRATDPDGESVEVSFNIVAQFVDDPPRVVKSIPWPGTIEPGVPFELVPPPGAFYDEEGQPFTVELTVRVDIPSDTPTDWIHFDPVTYAVTGTPSIDDWGSVELEFVATQAAHPGARWGLANIPLAVRDRSQPPRLDVDYAPETATVDAPFSMSVHGHFVDPEGGPLTYTVAGLPAWASFDPSTDEITGTPTTTDGRPRKVEIVATDRRRKYTPTWLDLSVARDGSAGPVHKVAGTFRAQPGGRVDTDTNDPYAPSVPNTPPHENQLFRTTPFIVGGWTNDWVTSRAGDVYESSNDDADVYRAPLKAGQVVHLLVSNHAIDATDYEHNAYMVLFDGYGAMIDGTAEFDREATLDVPADGDYYIGVYGYRYGSKYLVWTEDPGTGGTRKRGVTARSDFIPGQAIVTLDQRTALAKRGDLGAVAAALSAKPIAGAPDRPFLLDVSAAAELRKRGVPADSLLGRALADPKLGTKLATLLAIGDLQATPGVASVSPNLIRKPLALPDDPLYPQQWALPMIDAPEAWNITTGSTDVVVAVVDSGIRPEHPDLAPNLVQGYDFLSFQDGGDGDGIDPDPTENTGITPPVGLIYHGTHVSGTIGAIGDNGIGVAGVAWHTKIMPVRVVGPNGAPLYSIVQGVRYAAGLSNDSGTVPAKRADVINMSFGGPEFVQEEADALAAARAAGVILIAAAGNDSSADLFYPASCDGVVSVGAVTVSRRRAIYSNHNASLDVVAPGGDDRVDNDGDGNPDGILSTMGHEDWIDFLDPFKGKVFYPDYSQLNGTSMASPHVAGVAALMKSVDPALTPAQFDADLAAGLLTQDLGDDGPTVRNDLYGYGLIDAAKAVRRANERAGHTITAPVVVADQTSVGFDFAETERTIVFRNIGTGTPHVLSVTTDAPWMTVSPLSVDANGLGSYGLAVDRTGLGTGYYQATLTATLDTLPAITLPVYLRVIVPSDLSDDDGFHYVVLVDPVSLEPVAGGIATLTDGVYSYEIDGVPDGSWLLYAGTDLDDDGMICQLGEACGAYPSYTAPTAVVVSGSDVTLAEFGTAYRFDATTFGVPPTMMKRAPFGIPKQVRRPTVPVPPAPRPGQPSDVIDERPATRVK